MNKALITVGMLLLVGFISFSVLGKNENLNNKNVLSGGETVATIYKTPTCGCCGVYVSYMKKEGYEVEIENVQNLSVIKQKLGVPLELESCHTTEVGGYVVEGHIPNEAILRLLTLKPNIKGIGMAGMPSGSPGMPGPKTEDFVIYEITNEGIRGDIFMII